MRCDQWREVISARLDDETTEDERAGLEVHLQQCPTCRRHAEEAAALGRAVRVRPAEAVPDLTGAILRAANPPRPPRPPLWHRWARLALAWVAVAQLALALPALVLGDGAGATPHVARHLGSFDIALAVGLLAAAWRPERARPLLPVAAVLAASLVATGLVDLRDGATTGGLEALHVADLLGVALLWVVASTARPLTGGRARGPAATAVQAP